MCPSSKCSPMRLFSLPSAGATCSPYFSLNHIAKWLELEDDAFHCDRTSIVLGRLAAVSLTELIQCLTGSMTAKSPLATWAYPRLRDAYDCLVCSSLGPHIICRMISPVCGSVLANVIAVTMGSNESPPNFLTARAASFLIP